MIESQALNLENVDEGKPITFTPLEWRFFVSQLNDMISIGGEFDLIQVIDNARYLALLDKSFKELEEKKCVTFTEKEWDAFVKAQELYLDGR